MVSQSSSRVLAVSLRLFLAILSHFLLTGCFSRWIPEYVGSEKENEDIREFVFRLTFDELSKAAKESSIYCIYSEAPIDEMLLRLKDVGVQLRRQSDCETDDLGAKERSTRQRATIFGVTKIRWISKSMVIVESSMYSTPLSSRSVRMRLIKATNWQVDKVLMETIS